MIHGPTTGVLADKSQRNFALLRQEFEGSPVERDQNFSTQLSLEKINDILTS